MGNKQYYDAKFLYITAYELVKYIDGSLPMNACIALESLAQVCAIEGEINTAINHLDNLINILQTESDKNDPNSDENNNITDKDRKNIDIDNNDEDELKNKLMKDKYNDFKIKLLNVRAYYSCILSLYCYQHQHHEDIGFKLNKSFEIYEDILKEVVNQYGDTDVITFGVYLYFGLHFVRIQKFEHAFQHIEYIKNHTDYKHNNKHRELTYDEKKLFQQLLTAFISKLMTIGDDKKSDLMMFNNNELKKNCLKVFEYQLLSTDDFNDEIIQRQKEKERKEMEKKKIKIEQELKNNNNTNHNKHRNGKTKIKKEKLTDDEILEKEKVDQFINKQKQQNQDIVIDKNDVLINQHMMLLLHKFKDFNRVQGIINNFEQSQVTLNNHQIKQFEEIKQDLKVLQEQNMNNNINNDHNNSIDLNDGNSKSSNHAILSPQSMHHHGVSRYDFNAIPNFLPAAPGSE